MPRTGDISDEKILLTRVSTGDESAFHELVNRYAHQLYSFIYRIINNRERAEDLVQDCFIRIWLSREHLAGVNNFRAYLFVISRNFAIKAAQKKLKEQHNFAQWVSSFNAEQPDNEWKFSLIDEAIAQLPPQQYKVWIMSRRRGMKYAEIAKELGLSRESVKKYLGFANANIIEYVRKMLDLMVILALCLCNSL